MNWLAIVVAGIIIIGAIVGFVRGALRIAVSLAATVLTMVVVYIATPYVSKAIISFTPADEMLEEQCLDIMTSVVTGESTGSSGLTEEQVRAMLEGAGVSEAELAAAGISVQDIVDGKVSGEDLTKYGISAGILQGHASDPEGAQQSILEVEVPRQTQIDVIEGADIPEVFKELLLDNNNSEVYEKLGATTFAEYVSYYFAKLVIDILSFLITFLVVTIIVRAIVFALDFVTELPVLGVLNRLAGTVAGMAVSLIIIGFLFIILTLLYMTGFGKMMMGMIEESGFLSFLYDNNLIMKIVTALR